MLSVGRIDALFRRHVTEPSLSTTRKPSVLKPLLPVAHSHGSTNDLAEGWCVIRRVRDMGASKPKRALNNVRSIPIHTV